MTRRLSGSVLGVACASFVLLGSHATAEVYINELFLDPGGAGFDQRDEFIELRGMAGMSLENHYLLFLEGEDNVEGTGAAGTIDNLFDLGEASLGSNGYLVLRQSGNKTGDINDSGPSRYTPAPGATDLLNTGTGPGYGSGPGSIIGAQDVGGEGSIENGAFTAMLIRNDSGEIPALGEDLDVGNDGLDNPNGREGWSILDAIAAFEPLETVFGRSYAPIAYGREEIGQQVFFAGGIREIDPGLEPGAEYVGVGFEVEYLGRWGNSTGQTDADWHASNLTDNPGSGAIPEASLPDGSPLDYRQSFTGDHGELASGDPSTPSSQPTETQGSLESNREVPYGTRLLTNVGAPNYITGDYNNDGVVNAADYTVWRDTTSVLGSESVHPEADHNHDFRVDQSDYDLWAKHFGSPHSTPVVIASAAVPEPTTLAVLLGGLLAAAFRRS